MYKQRRQSGLKSGGRGFGSTKFRFFQANFREISNFSGNFRKSSIVKSKFSRDFDCSRQILEKFRFLEANVLKILIFSGKFSKNLIFYLNFDFQAILKRDSIFQAKMAHLQLLLGKLFHFSSKVKAFEHTFCT